MTFSAYQCKWTKRNGAPFTRNETLKQHEPLTIEQAHIIRTTGTLTAQHSNGEEQWVVRYPDYQYDILFVIHP